MKKKSSPLPQLTQTAKPSGWLQVGAALHCAAAPIAHPIPKLSPPPPRPHRLPPFAASTLQRFNLLSTYPFNLLTHLTHLTPGPGPCNLVTLVTLVTVLASGCAVPRALKGGRALTTPKPAGGLEQTLVQGENPAQATKQDQQTIKVRTYTVPAGSRLESASSAPSSILYPPSSPPSSIPSAFPTPHSLSSVASAKGDALRTQSTPSSILYPPSSSSAHPASPPSSILYPPSSSFILSAPMPVTEREETRANTELGPAQKDTARELGAKLASLKSIVWAGLALFTFGLASLFYPPLRALINSITTSLALTLGGLALMVLPSLIAGNELLLLGGVTLVIVSWFLAHRHGQLRGSLQPQPVPIRYVSAAPSLAPSDLSSVASAKEDGERAGVGRLSSSR